MYRCELQWCLRHLLKECRGSVAVTPVQLSEHMTIAQGNVEAVHFRRRPYNHHQKARQPVTGFEMHLLKTVNVGLRWAWT